MPDINNNIGINNNTTPVIPSGLNSQPGSYAESILDKYRENKKLREINAFSAGTTPATQVPTGPTGNKYPYFSPFVESNEELYGSYQSWYNKAMNGILKGTGLAATTFLNGTVGLIAGIGNSITSGKFSDFYNNDFSRSLDDFNKRMENLLPNYYSKEEQEAEWYSPKNLFTANFVFDKVIKNLGYSVGAIGAGLTYVQALRALGLFSKVASAGGLARTAELMESSISPVAQVENNVSSAISTAAREYLKSYSTLNTAQRFIAAGLSTVGEAGFEALQQLNDYRKNLINEYVQEIGQLPTGKDLQEINTYSERAANTLFGLNTVLLTGTNYVQLPKILGSSFRAENKLYTDAIRQTGKIIFNKDLGKYVVDAPTSLLGKTLMKGKNFASLFFNTEGFEELSQTGFNFGVNNYYDKARKGKSPDFFKDLLGEGYYKSLTTKEGLESALIGALSGGLFEARRHFKAHGLLGTGGYVTKNTAAAVDAFNKKLFTGFLRDNLDATKRAAVLQEERAAAIRRGDILNSKDLEFDYSHNYLSNRIKYDRFDLVMDDLNQYRNIASTPEGLQQLKEQGVVDDDITSEQLIGRINNIESHAKNVKLFYSTYNSRYATQKDKNGKIIYPESVIDKMVYAASKIADYDQRIPQISQQLLLHQINVQPLLDSLIHEDKATEQNVIDTFNQIRSLNISENEKDKLKIDIRDLSELTLRRKHFLVETDTLKNSPADFIKKKYGNTGTVAAPKAVQQKQENGISEEKDLMYNVQYPINLGVTRDENKIELLPEITLHSMNLLGEYQVSDKNGKVSYLSQEELNDINIEDYGSEIYKQELEKKLAELVDAKVKEQNLQYPEEITNQTMPSLSNKITWINTLDNEDLINEIEKGAKSIFSSFVEKKRKLKEFENEKKLIDDTDRLQQEIEQQSGNTYTNSIDYDNQILVPGDSSAKKPIDIVFRSTTSEPSDLKNTSENDDFHRRANKFLSEIENFDNREDIRIMLVTRSNQDSLGLIGLIPETIPGTDIENSNPQEGTIRAVFVKSTNEGSYYLDVNGTIISKVGSPVDYNKLVYSTLPNASLTWRNGETRYISDGKNATDENTAKKYQQLWKKQRAEILKSKSYQEYSFSISRGRPNYSDFSNISVVNTLINDNDLNTSVLVIPTVTKDGKGQIIHNEETLWMPAGRPILQKGSVFLPLNNRKLTNLEKINIKKLLILFSRQAAKGKINKDILRNLQSILFWKKPNTGDKIGHNQIWFDKGYLYFSEKQTAVPLISEYVENSQELTDFIDNAYFSVNNYHLKNNSTLPFNQVENVDLKTETIQYIQWKSYTHYLLDDKYSTTKDDASGKGMQVRPIEDIPLTINLLDKKNSTDKYASNFEQKYAILRNFQTPVEITPSPRQEKNSKSESSIKENNIILDLAQKIANNNQLDSLDLEFYEKNEDAILKEVEKIITKSTKSAKEKQKTITSAGAFVLDGRTLNEIKVKGKLVAKIAAIIKDGDIVITDYMHTLKKKLTDEIKEVTITIAKSQIAAEIIKKRPQPSSKEKIIPPNNEDATATSITSDVEKPVIDQSPTKEDNKKSASDLFNNLDLGPIDDSNYRLVTEQEYVPEDIEKTVNYLSRILPAIEVQIVDDLIRVTSNGYAWGMFRNNIITLYRNAQAGTGFHEAFEAVYNAILSNSQKTELLREFRSRPGSFTDRVTHKLITYKESSDLQAKEELAELFREYVTTGKLPATAKEKNLFLRIWNYLKSFLGFSNSIETTFRKINTGFYAEKPVSEPLPVEHYSQIPLNSKFQNDINQGVTAFLLDELFKNNSNIINLEESAVSVDDLYQLVYEKLDRYYNKDLPSQINHTIQSSNVSEKVAEDLRQIYTDFYNNTWPPIQKNWALIVEKNKEYLRSLKISIDETEEELTDNNRSYKEYDSDIFKMSAINNASTAVRLLINTLTEVKGNGAELLNGRDFSTPARQHSSLKLPIIVNYAKTFNKLLFSTTHSTTLSDMIENIRSLAVKDPKYIRLYNRLRIGTGAENRNQDDWKLLLKLYSVLSKSRPTFSIQQTDETGKTYLLSSTEAVGAKKLVESWMTNVISSSGDANSPIFFDKKSYKINKEVLHAIDTKAVSGKINFINRIFNIGFTETDYNELSGYLKKQFNDVVISLQSTLLKSNEVATITGRSLGINGPLTKLASVVLQTKGEFDEPVHLNVEGETVQNIVLNNYLSLLLKDINSSATKTDLITTLPQLNDIFSRNSLLLEFGGVLFDENGKRRTDQLKLSIIEGTTSSSKNRNTHSSELNLPFRRVLELNHNLNGIYYILIPADSKNEWALDLSYHFIDFSELSNKKSFQKKIGRIFSSYLKDEVALIKLHDSRAQKSIHVKKFGKKLRFLNTILDEQFKTELFSILDTENIEDWIDKKVDLISENVLSWLQEMSQNHMNELIKTGIVTYERENKLGFPMLDGDFLEKYGFTSLLSPGELSNILLFRNVNYVLANIEMHKVFFGDPAAINDETKRIKSFLSGREITYHTDNEFNLFANRSYNQVKYDESVIHLTDKDPGYHIFKDFLRSSTISDVIPVGSLALRPDIANEIKTEYENGTENDAQSYISLSAYRELCLKSGGRWTRDMESQYQYEYAFERYDRFKNGNYNYSSEELKLHDYNIFEKNPHSGVFHVIKPIASGVKHQSSDINLLLDKTSTVPIFYRMAKGRSLEKIYLKMQQEGIDYLIPPSGRKIGVEIIHNTYTPNGEPNISAKFPALNVPFKYMGIQQETSAPKRKQVRGSQATKIVGINLFNDSVPVDVDLSPDAWNSLTVGEKEKSSKIFKTFDEYTRILNALTERGYQQVLSKLDIRETDEGYHIYDYSKVIDLIRSEALSRDIPDNMKDALGVDSDGELIIPLEAVPNHESLKRVLYSIIDKYILSPKMNGGSKIQISSTLFEKNNREALFKRDGDQNSPWQKVADFASLSEAEKSTVRLTSSELKFYSPEHPYMEVLVPHWFRELYGVEIGEKDVFEKLDRINSELLYAIGFRIPTQELNFLESIRIAGFLEKEMGDCIVVPSEIVVKSSTDFDVDKLNTYLKNYYLTEDNTPIAHKLIIRDTTTEEGLMEIYEDLRLYKAAPLKKGTSQSVNKLLSSIFSTEISDEETDIADLDTFIRQNFGADIYSIYAKYNPKALENEYFRKMQELITLPQNFNRLIKPNSASEMKAIRNELLSAQGKNIEQEKNIGTLLDPFVMSELRHNYITGKKGVGIAALQQTLTAISQRAGVVLDHRNYRDKLTPAQQPLVQNFDILLPHNTIELKGESFISISAILDQDGKFISDKNSQYIDGYVDLVKDPFIIHLGARLSVASIFLFLEKAGVPSRDVVMFMNQPIIQDFINRMEMEGYSNPSSVSSRLIELAKSAYPAKNIERRKLTADLLKPMIYKSAHGESLNITENSIQQLVLDEFLKYSVFANHLFEFNQGLNYDTATLNTSSLFIRKEAQSEMAGSSNLFSGMDKILEYTFLSKIKEYANKSREALGEISKFESGRAYKIINDVLKEYIKRDIPISEKDFVFIGNRLQSSFLDFLAIVYSPMAGQLKIQDLFYSDESVANQLISIKNNPNIDPQISGSDLIQNLQVIYERNNPAGIRSIALLTQPQDIYTYNLLTSQMRILRDHPQTSDFYLNLVRSAIMSGSRRSISSLSEIIPFEDYQKFFSDPLSKLEILPDLESFKSINAFQRNNYSSDAIVPLVIPKEYNDGFSNTIPIFSVPTFLFRNLGITDRSQYNLIQLHSHYNRRESAYDIVKIRKIKLNPLTKQKYTLREQAEMRKNKDYSYLSYELYQKVYTYDEHGNRIPLGYSEKNSKLAGATYFIYKQINPWGAPNQIVEYYITPEKSVITNNRSVDEIPDEQIVAAFQKRESFLQLEDSENRFNTPSSASRDTLDKIKSFLENTGIDVKRVNNIVVDGKIISANAISHISEKLIQINAGHKEIATVLPEEAMHFVVEILDQQFPELFNSLMNEITSYKIYKNVLLQYGGNKLYQLNGKPDIRKIKKEALAKLLVEVVIKQNEGSTENPELLSKAQSWWKKILNYIKKIFNISNYDPFYNVAKSFLNNEFTNLNNSLSTDQNREIYLQASSNPHQEELVEKIQNIQNQIIKIEGKGSSYYEVNGRKISNRVTNLAADYLNSKFRFSSFSPSEHAQLLNEQKRDKGTDGHADFEDIFHRFVDSKGYLRVQELPQTNVSRLDPNNNAHYKKLESNLRDRLHNYPVGTRFFAEVLIYDEQKDIAGTIDFLAIQPDINTQPGKVNIIDWKFITAFRGENDIKSYKKESWNIQLQEYKRILQVAYGVKKESFGQTRVIPIKTSYKYANKQKSALKLKNIEIGSIDPLKITDDILLPVPIDTESNSNKGIETLLGTLNNLVSKIRESAFVPGQEFIKTERIKDLLEAIRQLKVKEKMEKLLEFARSDIKRYNGTINSYLEKLENSSAVGDINKISYSLLEAEDILSFYAAISRTLRTSYDPILYRDLMKETEMISANAEVVKSKLIDLANKLRSEVIAKGLSLSDMMSPEKTVSWYTKNVRSLSQAGTNATRILWKMVNKINAQVQFDFDMAYGELSRIKKNVKTWMEKNSKSITDLQELLLNLNEKKEWNGRIMPKISSNFYTELQKAKDQSNSKWVDENIDTDQYFQWYEEELKNRTEIYKTARFHSDDVEDARIKYKRLENFKRQFDFRAHPKTAISKANLKLGSYPQQEKWFSEKYKKLLDPGAEPVMELYKFYEKILDQSYELGMIKAWERKTFFPNVRKDLLDKMVFGAFSSAGKKGANLGWLNSIRVDINDNIYGYTDINGNPSDKLSALYMYDLGEKVVTETGEEVTDYSNKSTDLFKVMALWINEMYKYKYKSEVIDSARLIHFTETQRKALGYNKKTGAVLMKNTGDPVLIDNVENSEYYKNFLDFYFYNRKISAGQDVIFQFKYNELANKVNKFFKYNLLSLHNEEEIHISGKKLVSALNRYHQLRILGVNMRTAITNFFGGSANAYMLAGRHFTKKDFSVASLKFAASNFSTPEGKIYAGLLSFFLPLTEDTTQFKINSLSVSTAVKTFNPDHLFYMMRGSDKLIQYPAAIAYLDNTMIENGELVNIREYVKNKYQYGGLYTLSNSERKELKFKIEKEIENLKRTRSLPVVAKLVNDKIELEGINRHSDTVIDFRNRIQQFSKNALGNMSQDDVSQYRMTLLGQSFMMFKNWIPRMADVRFSEFRYNVGTESYEWGRMSMLFNALKHGILSGSSAALGLLVGKSESMVQIAQKVYAEKILQVEMQGGKFNMTEADFIDYYIKGIRTQLKEVLLMLTMMGIFMFAKSSVPDDKDKRGNGFFKWMLATIDKLCDELSFFLNPLSFSSIANGSVFPSIQILNDIVLLFKGITMEGFYMIIDDEVAQEKNKVAKYLFKSAPITKELMIYAAMLNEDIAKNYGITITTNLRRR